jgi:hypothetical protein
VSIPKHSQKKFFGGWLCFELFRLRRRRMSIFSALSFLSIEGECYFHMPPGALLKVISFALYKHVCITFQPTLVCTASNISPSFYTVHLLWPVCADGMNASLLRLQCTTANMCPVRLCLVLLPVLVFPRCSCSIFITKAMHEMQISILHITTSLLLSLLCHWK